MLNYLFSFLPFIVTLCWSVAFLLRKDKSYQQMYYTFTIPVIMLYFFSDAIYVLAKPDYHMFLIADVVSQFSSPMLPLILLLYLKSLYSSSAYTSDIFVVLLPGIVMGLGSLLIYYAVGFDEAAGYMAAYDAGDTSAYDHPLFSLIKLWTNRIYSIVLGASMLFALAGFVPKMFSTARQTGYRFFRFITGKGRYNTSLLQSHLVLMIIIVSGIRLLLGRSYLIPHPLLSYTLSLLTALLLFAMSFFAYHYKNEGDYLKDFIRWNNYGDGNPESLLKCVHKAEEYDKVPLGELEIENNACQIYSLIVDEAYYRDENASLKGASEILGMPSHTIRATIATMCHCNIYKVLEFCRNEFKK